MLLPQDALAPPSPEAARPAPQAGNLASLLSDAVNASLTSSLSPEGRVAGGQRLGGGEEGPASTTREPPAMPAAAETRRRALEAAEARAARAADAAAAENGTGVLARHAAGDGAGGDVEQAAQALRDEQELHNGMRVGDVAAPGYLFGGVHLGVPFYVCQATQTSIWELPPAEHLAAVARTQGTHGAARQLRPGDPVPGHPGYLFGGYSSGLPFYHCEDSGRSVWELPRAEAVRAHGGEEAPVRDAEPAEAARRTASAAAAAAATALSEDMSGEGEVEAALAAQRRRRPGGGEHAANVAAVLAGGGNAAAQEDSDRALAARLQAEFEEVEREQATRAAARARELEREEGPDEEGGQRRGERESVGGGDAVADAEAEEARQAAAAHEREMRRQQEEQTALEERLRREAAGRQNAQEAASRRAMQPDDAASRQRHAEEERWVCGQAGEWG